jgi:hypothetical protein
MPKDVLIVGGGPIGLAHAWGIKCLNPQLNVVVFEKYQEYQRKHTLVMQHQQLQKLMAATNTQDDPILSKLLADLQKDPHIRTSTLEAIFKKQALERGVTIVNKEITAKEIENQLFREYPDAGLIIGADGTHSVVSGCLFPADNQIKHDFDYVLQLRYEVMGEEQAPKIDPALFYNEMVSKGLIANEYVGHFDPETRTTPVTMQMMISKKDFAELSHATSKKPIKPFTDEHLVISLPKALQDFVYDYLIYKITSCEQNYARIDKTSIRISVNEAPATEAMNIATMHSGVPIVLGGDAGLGLSYFLGLNAGLHSTATFLTMLVPFIQSNLDDKKAMKDNFSEYQRWFKEFAADKVNEVAQYSKNRINRPWQAIKFVKYMRHFSEEPVRNPQAQSIVDYFTIYERAPYDPAAKWNPYPHREYPLVSFVQMTPVPVGYTVKRIQKSFADYLKPYKSMGNLRQDLKQPLAGLGYLTLGAWKLLSSIYRHDSDYAKDGAITLVRGGIEVIMFPLTWLVKPAIRGVLSYKHGPIKIEDNKGMKKIVQDALELTVRLNDQVEIPIADEKAVLAYRNDVHRKFIKACERGQPSDIDPGKEQVAYNEINRSRVLNTAKTINYFSIFSKPTSVPDSELNPAHSPTM